MHKRREEVVKNMARTLLSIKNWKGMGEGGREGGRGGGGEGGREERERGREGER